MKRRTLLAGLGGTVAWPLAVRAQSAGRVFRVGLVFTTSPVSDMAGSDPLIPSARAFVHALRAQGYIEGQNLVLERRSAEGRFERFGEILTELVEGKVDVLVTSSDEVTRVAMRVTREIPIVMSYSYDPVGAGLIASLARPGGNVTGLAGTGGHEIEGKKLQFLKEVLPEATRIAYLGTNTDWNGPQATYVRAVAPMLGVTLVHAEVTPNSYAEAFALITRDRPHALFLASHPTHYANRKMIAEFTVKQRMPSMFSSRDYVEAGGLISYGIHTSDLYRHAAGHVVKILKGAKPADLPVEQPTKFVLAINLKTAKILDLAIPPTLLVLADEVIE
jgi:putative tryptophan/tyrosine transport system substrate-binding protein